MPFFIPFLVIAGVAILASKGSEKVDPDLEDTIALVGPTSAGKSLLGNELLGRAAFGVDARHGTTRDISVASYVDGWSIADTPGVLDGDDLAAIALQQARRSRVIVMCVDGEMYRQTREWLETLISACHRSQKLVIIPYVTKTDLRRLTMTRRDAAKVEEAIKRQFSELSNGNSLANVQVAEVLLGEPGDRFSLKRAIRIAMNSTKA